MSLTASQLKAIKRGQVVWVDLDPKAGVELGKVRPCIVISDDRYNKTLDTIIIVPVTTPKVYRPALAHEVTLPKGEGGLEADSIAAPCAVRGVDSDSRVVRLGSMISERRLEEITDKLLHAIGHHWVRSRPGSDS